MVGRSGRRADDSAPHRSDTSSSTPPAQQVVLGGMNHGRHIAAVTGAMALAVPGGVVKMIVGHHTLHEVERRVPDHHVGLANVPTAPHGVRVSTFTVIGQLLEIVLRHTSYLPARRHDTERDTYNFTP